MQRLRAGIVCVAMLVAPSAWAATEIVGGAGAGLVRDTAGASSRETTELTTGNLYTARAAGESDEPFALDDATLAKGVPAAPERNPFALTALLIAFAGLTALFARKRTAGRGLIAA